MKQPSENETNDTERRSTNVTTHVTKIPHVCTFLVCAIESVHLLKMHLVYTVHHTHGLAHI